MKVLPRISCALLTMATLATAGTITYRGVNLAGAEFTPAALPGTENSTYGWPTATSSQYYINKGMNTIRLPFLWERLQPTQGGTFSSDYWSKLKTTVSSMTAKGAYVIVDPHNYARHSGQVLGDGLTNAEFADLWTKLATEFKSNNKVIFGIMNEPHSMGTETWFSAAQFAITAIRATGASNMILVPGNAWTGAHSWGQNWYGTPNATVALTISDPGNNMAFEVHQYLDSDYSGTNNGCKSTTVGSAALKTFTNWLKTNNKKGFLGEFAGTNDATCQSAVNDMLTYLEANSDVWVGWTWWAGGPMWGDYMFTLEPNGSDRPQMAWLASHLTGSVTPSSAVVSSSIAVSSSAITVSSSAANTAPVATADSYNTQEDAPISVNAPGILSNDNDANGNTISALLVSNVTHGTLALNSNGSFVYTPAADYSGADAFTYRPYDGMAYGNTVTVSITVRNVNDAPTGNSDNYATTQNTTLTTTTANGVLTNDIDPEGAALYAILVTNPSHGFLTLNGNGTFTYIPTTGFTGSDAFGYKPNDGTSNGITVTVSINVTAGSNAAPVATNDAYSTQEDGVLETYTWNNILQNDTDPNGDALTSVLVTSPSHGTVQLNSDGTYLYTPTANYSGTDAFTYKAFDGTVQSTEATVTITITAQNDNPTVATPVPAQKLSGGFAPFTIDLSEVFVDPDGDNLTISTDGFWMATGTLTGKSLTLAPASGMSGTQTVTLRASDSKGGQAISTFELTVDPLIPTCLRPSSFAGKIHWRNAVQQGRGIAVVRDLYGREHARIQLPCTPEDIHALTQSKRIFLLQIGKQTYRLD